MSRAVSDISLHPRPPVLGNYRTHHAQLLLELERYGRFYGTYRHSFLAPPSSTLNAANSKAEFQENARVTSQKFTAAVRELGMPCGFISFLVIGRILYILDVFLEESMMLQLHVIQHLRTTLADLSTDEGAEEVCVLMQGCAGYNKLTLYLSMGLNREHRCCVIQKVNGTLIASPIRTSALHWPP